MSPSSTGEGLDRSVRLAGKADCARIVAMLARAFADDPAMSFIFPDPMERARRLPRLFGLLFDADALNGMRLVSVGGEAAAFWCAPGYMMTRLLDLLFQAWPVCRTFGSAIGRALAVSNAIDAHLPRGPHWYLHVVGCDPAAQGRGFGAAVIRSGLDRVAGSRLPACLETAVEANVGFYQSCGFAVTEDWAVPGGGPRFWSMVRR